MKGKSPQGRGPSQRATDILPGAKDVHSIREVLAEYLDDLEARYLAVSK